MYRRRISGPLLDRLDMQVDVQRVPTHELLEFEERVGVRSGGVLVERAFDAVASIAARIRFLRDVQNRRQRICNARLGISDVKRYCSPDTGGRRIIERAADQLGLSARGYHRILKVARTVADLANEEHVLENHVAEAIALRTLDRRSPE